MKYRRLVCRCRWQSFYGFGEHGFVLGEAYGSLLLQFGVGDGILSVEFGKLFVEPCSGDGSLSLDFVELQLPGSVGLGTFQLPSSRIGSDLGDDLGEAVGKVLALGRKVGKRIRRRSGSWIGRRNGRDRPSMGGGTNPNNRRAKPDLEASSRGLNDGLSAMTMEASLDD